MEEFLANQFCFDNIVEELLSDCQELDSGNNDIVGK